MPGVAAVIPVHPGGHRAGLLKPGCGGKAGKMGAEMGYLPC